MNWQDAGVIVIVAGAVYFLVRKFLLPPKRKSTAVTFVSIEQLKSKPKAKP